jgi:hypothetical protein
MTLMTERTGEESPDYRQRPGSLATASAEGRGSIALTMKVTEGETVAAYSMAVLGQDQMRVEHLVKPEDERAVSYFLPSNAMAVRDEDVALFGDLSMGKAAGRIVEALQTMDARIANVTTIQGPAGPMLFADVGLPKLLPLPFLGEGVHRLLAILLRVAAARGGVVLIDGIEHSIHHSAMPALWAAVRDLASGHGTQVFATTQSWECVVAASEAFAEAPPEQFLLHRIERRGDQLVAVTYEPDVLGAAVEHGFEVR